MTNALSISISPSIRSVNNNDNGDNGDNGDDGGKSKSPRSLSDPTSNRPKKVDQRASQPIKLNYNTYRSSVTDLLECIDYLLELLEKLISMSQYRLSLGMISPQLYTLFVNNIGNSIIKIEDSIQECTRELNERDISFTTLTTPQLSIPYIELPTFDSVTAGGDPNLISSSIGIYTSILHDIRKVKDDCENEEKSIKYPVKKCFECHYSAAILTYLLSIKRLVFELSTAEIDYQGLINILVGMDE
ncbi:uncharacterized protein CMU_002180 [Cryptosporidium muris RN66]|uniref:Uncharacterized protein n=1 Tax=Cryptosporidium muris (strain RN66) TaxID=441375 RepID=B6AGK6_CRYMR|nr:uncharacterized protein CMU_002180 [Cryptosporidium muris RN66]EEA07347.1 hypothetical protein CMU_002180 [Cryptosporidium muris RN66]|eukprot:XP_002141696.1 hypothetical protein [Cryptosporidium muris RN66]